MTDENFNHITINKIESAKSLNQLFDICHEVISSKQSVSYQRICPLKTLFFKFTQHYKFDDVTKLLKTVLLSYANLNGFTNKIDNIDLVNLKWLFTENVIGLSTFFNFSFIEKLYSLWDVHKIWIFLRKLYYDSDESAIYKIKSFPEPLMTIQEMLKLPELLKSLKLPLLLFHYGKDEELFQNDSCNMVYDRKVSPKDFFLEDLFIQYPHILASSVYKSNETLMLESDKFPNSYFITNQVDNPKIYQEYHFTIFGLMNEFRRINTITGYSDENFTFSKEWWSFLEDFRTNNSHKDTDKLRNSEKFSSYPRIQNSFNRTKYYEIIEKYSNFLSYYIINDSIQQSIERIFTNKKIQGNCNSSPESRRNSNPNKFNDNLERLIPSSYSSRTFRIKSLTENEIKISLTRTRAAEEKPLQKSLSYDCHSNSTIHEHRLKIKRMDPLKIEIPQTTTEISDYSVKREKVSQYIDNMLKGMFDFTKLPRHSYSSNRDKKSNLGKSQRHCRLKRPPLDGQLPVKRLYKGVTNWPLISPNQENLLKSYVTSFVSKCLYTAMQETLKRSHGQEEISHGRKLSFVINSEWLTNDGNANAQVRILLLWISLGISRLLNVSSQVDADHYRPSILICALRISEKGPLADLEEVVGKIINSGLTCGTLLKIIFDYCKMRSKHLEELNLITPKEMKMPNDAQSVDNRPDILINSRLYSNYSKDNSLFRYILNYIRVGSGE